MKKINNIDAILFDLMGVLLFKKKDYLPDPLIDAIDASAGLVTDDAVFKNEILEKYRLNEKEFDEALHKIANKYEPFQKLWGLLPLLKNFYRLAIVNNGTALTLPMLDWKLHFSKYFDLFVSSAKERAKKPDSKIYLTAAKRLGATPEHCLFMDDSLENIEGAKSIGMRTLLWLDKEEGFKKFVELTGA